MKYKYFKKVLLHKWFVFLEARKLGVGWLGLIHDWSKFTKQEFDAYSQYFYGFAYGSSDEVPMFVRGQFSYKLQEDVDNTFNHAWNAHQKRNKHHWQYWMLTSDVDEPQTVALEMPLRYRKEMLADWRGAGRAYGNPNTQGWYMDHYHQIIVGPETRKWLDVQLEIVNVEKVVALHRELFVLQTEFLDVHLVAMCSRGYVKSESAKICDAETERVNALLHKELMNIIYAKANNYTWYKFNNETFGCDDPEFYEKLKSVSFVMDVYKSAGEDYSYVHMDSHMTVHDTTGRFAKVIGAL